MQQSLRIPTLICIDTVIIRIFTSRCEENCYFSSNYDFSSTLFCIPLVFITKILSMSHLCTYVVKGVHYVIVNVINGI